MFTRFIAVTIFVMTVILANGCTKEDGGRSMSAEAPDFTLQDLDGKKMTLSDFKGKVVMLDFWATWCPPCRASIPAIERIHKTYGDKGLAVLAIALDEGGWDSVKEFSTEYGITYRVLKGTDEVATKYLVRSIPTIILVDKQGNLYKQFMGFGNDALIEQEIKALL